MLILISMCHFYVSRVNGKGWDDGWLRLEHYELVGEQCFVTWVSVRVRYTMTTDVQRNVTNRSRIDPPC